MALIRFVPMRALSVRGQRGPTDRTDLFMVSPRPGLFGSTGEPHHKATSTLVTDLGAPSVPALLLVLPARHVYTVTHLFVKFSA